MCCRRPTDLRRLVNDRHQLFDCEPKSRCIDHAVTVGAQQAEIARLGFLTGSERVYWARVMAFDKTSAVLAVVLLEIKTAGFAS